MQLPGVITRNWRVKLLATGIALITWVGVVYASNPPESRTVSVHVPQDPASLPAKYVLSSPIPDIQVRVSGTRDNVNAFDPGSLRVGVDYSRINHAGVQQLPIHVVNNDSTVSLDQVPTTVSADVDVNDSVEVPVTLVFDATPPTGYTVTDQSLDHPSVTVTGPRRELGGLSAQVHLNLANQRTNLQGFYKVFLYDRFGRKVGSLGVNPDTVTVSLTISSVITSRVSAVLPRVTGTAPPGHYLASMTANPLTALISGPQDLLNGLDSISTQSISITGLGTGDHVVQVKLAPPAGVTATPDTVTVIVSIAALPQPTPLPAPTPTPTPTPTAAPASPTP
ncbi:MAG TPA: CdaR family protein [Candidatus Dormibacteraeota bacterium]|nr:CdaR family protein [Candidatus Dormibacteraeota bacterium]